MEGPKEIDPPVCTHAIALFTAASEANYGAERNTRAVDSAARIVEADIVDLRAQREVGQNADINAAAKAERELGIVPGAGTS